MLKKDNIFIGLIPAIIIPIVIAILLYDYWSLGPFSDFYRLSVGSGNLTKMLALGCFPNVGIFFLYIRANKIRAAQGVISGTLFYVMVTVYYMFLR